MENDGPWGSARFRNFSHLIGSGPRGAKDDRSINLLDTWNHDDVGGDFGGLTASEQGGPRGRQLLEVLGLKNFSLDSGGLLDL